MLKFPFSYTAPSDYLPLIDASIHTSCSRLKIICKNERRLYAIACLLNVLSVYRIIAEQTEVSAEDNAINIISRSCWSLEENFDPCKGEQLSVEYEAKAPECDNIMTKTETSSEPSVSCATDPVRCTP